MVGSVRMETRRGSTASTRRARRSTVKRKLTPYALLAPTLLMLTLLFVFPALYNIYLSFRNMTPYDALDGGTWAGLSNYREVLTSQETYDSLPNTILWLTLATVLIRLVVGMGISMLLQAEVLGRWKLRGIARTLVLVPWMVSPVVAVAAWSWILDAQGGVINQILMNIGLIDAGIPFLADTSTVWPAIVSIIVWRELPFVIIVLMAGLQTIPDDLYEAASLDGAGHTQSFLRVTLPSLRPVMFVILLMTTIQTFNNYVYVWLSTSGGPGTFTQVLATQLYSEAFIQNSLGTSAAIGMIMTAIMTLFAVIYIYSVFRKGAE